MKSGGCLKMKGFVKTYIRYIIYIYLVISLLDNLQRGYDYIQGEHKESYTEMQLITQDTYSLNTTVPSVNKTVHLKPTVPAKVPATVPTKAPQKVPTKVPANKPVNVPSNDKAASKKPSSTKDKCKQYDKDLNIKHVVKPYAIGGSRNGSKESICLITQLAFSKFERLQMVAEHWKGCISAALYLKKADIPSNEQTIKAWLNETKRTNIFIHVVEEQGVYYPINKLRNIAQDNINTEYIFLIDVDFMPSFDLEKVLLYRIHKGFYNSTKNKVIVVTAFEMLDKKHEFPASKKELLKLSKQKVIQPFHYRTKGAFYAHKPSDYPRWTNASWLFKIKYHQYYEPYILIRRKLSPTYDERFLQRGFNKDVHIAELHARGFEFWVEPNVYLVHMPHKYDTKTAQQVDSCVRKYYKLVLTEQSKIKAKS